MKYRYNKLRGESGLLLQDEAVLELLLEGKGRPRICRELDASMGTVNTCCDRIYKYMDVHSLPELLAKVFGRGNRQNGGQ